MRTDSASKRDPDAPHEPPTSILIIDGDNEHRALLQRHLLAGGYEVREATTIALAVQRIMVRAPDVLLVDFKLGSPSGLKLLQTLAVTDPRFALVLVAKTELAENTDLEALFAAGADDVVSMLSMTPASLRRAVDLALLRARVRVTRASELADIRRQLDLEGRLISIVGHDLRTPLSSLLMSLESINAGVPDPNLIGIAVRSGARIRDMVKQVLDLTRIREAAAFPLKRADVDLVPLLEQVVEEHRVISGREVLLQAEGASGKLRGVMDESAIGQLASNLVANALAHGERDRPVLVYAERHHELLVLRVANRGGIAEPELERVFSPFVRGDAGEGLGLGLYIARSIIESHGGELSARSVDGETEFEARWPSRGCASAGAGARLTQSVPETPVR